MFFHLQMNVFNIYARRQVLLKTCRLAICDGLLARLEVLVADL